jgi:hypothetical protein
VQHNQPVHVGERYPTQSRSPAVRAAVIQVAAKIFIM